MPCPRSGKRGSRKAQRRCAKSGARQGWYAHALAPCRPAPKAHPESATRGARRRPARLPWRCAASQYRRRARPRRLRAPPGSLPQRGARQNVSGGLAGYGSRDLTWQEAYRRPYEAGRDPPRCTYLTACRRQTRRRLRCLHAATPAGVRGGALRRGVARAAQGLKHHACLRPSLRHHGPLVVRLLALI